MSRSAVVPSTQLHFANIRCGCNQKQVTITDIEIYYFWCKASRKDGLWSPVLSFRKEVLNVIKKSKIWLDFIFFLISPSYLYLCGNWFLWNNMFTVGISVHIQDHIIVDATGFTVIICSVSVLRSMAWIQRWKFECIKILLMLWLHIIKITCKPIHNVMTYLRLANTCSWNESCWFNVRLLSIKIHISNIHNESGFLHCQTRYEA